MSVTTINVKKVRSVVKAVVEDWLKQWTGSMIVATYTLRHLYNMLVDRLRSIGVNDEVQMHIHLKPRARFTITVKLSSSKLVCTASLRTSHLDVFGDVSPYGEILLAGARPESSVQVTCNTSEE